MHKVNTFYFRLSLLYLVMGYTRTQYISVQHKTTIANSCSNSSRTVLVEHFFNLIFSEFHNNPPVCVCVQMCIDQPTYCYPNGCLKRTDTLKKETPQPASISQVQNDISKPMTFLVHDQSEFMSNFLEGNYVTDSRVVRTEKPLNDIRPDPFKDRYKSIFKYKKMPKVHLRYNLREQVKNTKSDIIKIEKIDVSKTRWPTHKHVGHNKQFFMESESQDKLDGSRSIKITPTFNAERTKSMSQSKFFKRELGKHGTVEVVVNSMELKDTTDNPSFILENLIENLIENSFSTLTNDTELDLNVNLDYSINNLTTREPITVPNKRFALSDRSAIILNETTNVISMNLTNENKDQNVYIDDSNHEEAYKNVFNEMIAALSKTIEKENNSSMELMEKVIGNMQEETTMRSTIQMSSMINETSKETSSISSIIITEIENSIEPSTTTTEATETSTRMKSRQKITRKLQNSKTN